MRKTLIYSICLIFILAATAPGGPVKAAPSPQDNNEPQPIAIGDVIEAELQSPYEGDAWTFEGSEGTVINIALESDVFDAYVTLQNANGEILAEDDDAGPGIDALIIGYELPADDTYTILAQTFSTAEVGAPYLLSLRETEFTEPGEIEYGSEVFAHFILPPAEEAAGEDERETRNENRWTFEGSEGDLIDIELSSPNFDTMLTLLDADGNVLIEDDDQGGYLNSRIFLYALPTDGTYTILVAAFGDSEGSEAYWLRLARTDAEGVLESGVQIEDSIRGRDFEVWFFEATAGQQATVGVESEDFDPRILLYNTDLEQLAEDDDSGEDMNALLENFEIPSDGIYLVVVIDAFETGSGDYTLSLTLE
jgi:hypothetical protein